MYGEKITGHIWPISGEERPSCMDMLCDAQPAMEVDGSQTWFAVSNPRAVRGQPMALFRTLADAQMTGARMTLGEVEIRPVTIRLPDDVPQPNAAMVPITLITD